MHVHSGFVGRRGRHCRAYRCSAEVCSPGVSILTTPVLCLDSLGAGMIYMLGGFMVFVRVDMNPGMSATYWPRGASCSIQKHMRHR